MTTLETIREKLGTMEVWTQRGGVHWLAASGLQVRQVALRMNQVQARFITITASQLPGEHSFRLEYLWDLDGQLLGFAFEIAANTMESIYDLCEAADWIEREVYEGFAIDFQGRAYEPLLLRAGNPPGVNLQETLL